MKKHVQEYEDECFECGNSIQKLIRFCRRENEEVDGMFNPEFFVCKDCLKKALEMLEVLK